MKIIYFFLFLFLFNANNLYSKTIFKNRYYVKYRIEVSSINNIGKYLKRNSANVLKGLFLHNKTFIKNKKFILYITYDRHLHGSVFRRARIFIGKYVYNLFYVKRYKVFYITNTNPRDSIINNIFISSSDIYFLNKNSFFIWKPLKKLFVTSPFTLKRFHPVLRINKPHYGIDYRGKIGTPVYAVADGKIIYAGKYGSYGNYIKIKHKNHYYSEYAHLIRFYKSRKYLRRRWIKKGSIIGYIGNTGRSTGSHLHFGIKKRNQFINPELLYFYKNFNYKIKKLSNSFHYLKRNTRLIHNIKIISFKIDRLGS